MSKRDYKSYNVLGEEITQEEADEDVQRIDQGHIIDISLVKEESKELRSMMVIEEKKNEGAEIEEDDDKRINLNKVEVIVGSEEEQEFNFKRAQKEVEKDEDMTFSAYKKAYQTKERSRLVKWSIRLVKVMIILMLLPLLGILALTGLGLLGTFMVTTVAILGVGVLILGVTCFISTQISASIVALGISAAMTALSLGSILFILFIRLMKWIISFITKNRKLNKEISGKEAK